MKKKEWRQTVESCQQVMTAKQFKRFVATIQADALRAYVERNRVSTHDEWEKGFTAALNVALSDAIAIEQKAGTA